jgi:RNA polymerase sigma factor (sigma-70 family)
MATLSSPPTELSPEQLYLGHLKHIDAAARHSARRRHFNREEMEDFISTVRLKLLENDYEVIRKFQGKSSLRTFLTTVVERLMLDYQNHRWGKWRPSAEAERLGRAAMRLEMHLVRDGLTFDEACQILRMNEGVQLSREELEAIAVRLPARNPLRRMLGEEELADRPADGETPAESALGRETLQRKREILALLGEVLASLPAEDRLIAKMRGEFQVVRIAKTLGLEQKPLYRRVEKLLRTLRTELVARGVTAEEIAEILAFPERDVEEPP